MVVGPIDLRARRIGKVTGEEYSHPHNRAAGRAEARRELRRARKDRGAGVGHDWHGEHALLKVDQDQSGRFGVEVQSIAYGGK